jgi:3-isopropylmalate/(R)-2-methylmalate dehydratase small subunit
MSFVEKFSGLAAPLELANVDTDQMVPGRFLMKPRDFDYGSLLFHDLRFGKRRDPQFVLNQPRYEKTEILVSGENFGCGSAREQAAYALMEYGIRAVFATSFGNIFRRNCINNGLLLGTIAPGDVRKLCETISSRQGARLIIDAVAQTITDDDGDIVRFEIDRNDKQKLLGGIDEVDATLARQADIDGFERAHLAKVDWLYGPLGQDALKKLHKA